MRTVNQSHIKIDSNMTSFSDPVLLDTAMTAVSCHWNHDGSVLAIAGTMASVGGDNKEANVVQFYNPFGDHLRTLKVVNRNIALDLNVSGYFHKAI